MRTLLVWALLCLLGQQTAMAADRPTLTVYTYDALARKVLTPELTSRFEAECQCTLSLVNLGEPGNMLARLALEGSRTQADVVMGIDNNQRAEAHRTGLLGTLPAQLPASDLPVAWQDTTLMPIDWGWFAFVYDRERLTTPPTSLKALIDSDLRVVIEDPRTSTPGLGLLLWMKSVYGDGADKAWSRFSRHIVTATRSWTEAYGLFLRGEADAVLSYTTSPAYHIEKEHTDRYAAMPMSEGHYLQIELAGKIASSPHQQQADAFLKFMTTPEVQARLVNTNWMYPAYHKDTLTLPAGFNHLVVPEKTLLIDETALLNARRQWIREWQAALGGKG